MLNASDSDKAEDGNEKSDASYSNEVSKTLSEDLLKLKGKQAVEVRLQEGDAQHSTKQVYPNIFRDWVV